MKNTYNDSCYWGGQKVEMSSRIIWNGFACSSSRFLHITLHRLLSISCEWLLKRRLKATPYWRLHPTFFPQVFEQIVAIWRCRISTCLILLSIYEQCFLLLLVSLKLLFALYGEQKHSSVSLKYLQIPIIVLGLCQRYTCTSQTKIHQFSFCWLSDLLFYEVKTYF